MIARITRILLLIQAIFAIAICALAIKLWSISDPLIAALLGLGAVLAFRLAITINNFYLAWRFRSPVPDGFNLNGWQAVRLILREFQATMWASSWGMPFQSFDKHVASRPKGLPVLLVHGYGCNSGYWKPMSKVLAKAGITHCAINLEPVFASIDDYAAVVHKAIETLIEEAGSEKVVIVAHSMGGLAARAYVRDHDSAHVARVITLGTPHRGTALAHHAIGINTEQMCWSPEGEDGVSSDWLLELREQENEAARALFVSVYSHHDNIISPQTSSHLPGAKNIELHGIGHVALALDPKVQAIVIDEILKASQTPAAEPAAEVAIH